MRPPAGTFLTCIFILTAACANLPRDPKHTLDHIRERHTLRIGLVEHAPWVIRTEGEPSGVEVDMVRRLAANLGASPDWHWGSEDQHMHALEEYRLDLLAAGLHEDTPWQKKVGLTKKPYIFAVPPGENAWLKQIAEFEAAQ